jgi:hypothetical protein
VGPADYLLAGFGEAGLPSVTLATGQLQQFLTQDHIPEQVSQAIDDSFDGSNPAHHLRALLQELAQFFVGPAHYFLHVSVFDTGSGSDCDWLTLHKQSLSPACGAPRHW